MYSLITSTISLCLLIGILCLTIKGNKKVKELEDRVAKLEEK